MTHSIICDRAFEFAVRIVKLCDRMAARGFGASHIAKQLVRCGTSKEARETAWWLRLAIAVSAVKTAEVDWELKEANELRFMIRAAIRTARSSPDRGHHPAE